MKTFFFFFFFSIEFSPASILFYFILFYFFYFYFFDPRSFARNVALDGFCERKFKSVNQSINNLLRIVVIDFVHRGYILGDILEIYGFFFSKNIKDFYFSFMLIFYVLLEFLA